MSEDDTPVDAPAQADTAVDAPVQVETEAVATETAPAPVADTEAPAPERLFAGKYKSADVLEESHLNLQRQFTIETQRRAELERQLNANPPKLATPDKPTYTPEQLEGAKIDLLDKMADARVNGDAAKAREYASQIVWCDRELMNQRVASTQTQSRAMAAEQRLMQEVAGVVHQFQADLVPGNPLHDKAAQLLEDFVANGAANNAITQSLAVSMAAQLLGKTKGNVEQATRRELTKTIQSTLKSGVVAGAGHASAGTTQPLDFMNMSDAEYLAYQKTHGLK